MARISASSRIGQARSSTFAVRPSTFANFEKCLPLFDVDQIDAGAWLFPTARDSNLTAWSMEIATSVLELVQFGGIFVKKIGTFTKIGLTGSPGCLTERTADALSYVLSGYEPWPLMAWQVDRPKWTTPTHRKSGMPALTPRQSREWNVSMQK